MITRKLPPQIKLCLGIFSLLIVITVTAYHAIPLLPADHQGLTITITGSVVGTVLAFVGAAWLLVQEQRQIAVNAARRKDQVLLRKAHANVGSLMAFTYHDSQLDRASTELQKRLIKVNLEQNVALIRDEDLRTECELINVIALEPDLRYFIKGGGGGLYTARDWYLQLLSLDEGSSVTAARPPHYKDLKEGVDEWHEQQEEQWLAQMEQEEELQKKEETTSEAD